MKLNFLRILVLGFIILCLKQKSFSATCNWVGGTNANWSTASNWSCNAVPGSLDDVTISAGTNVPILDQGDVAVKNFTISGNKSLDLKGHILSISGVATFTSGSIISSTGIGNVNVNSSTTTTNFSSAGATMKFGDPLLYNVNVNVLASNIYVLGGLTVNGSFTIEKVGAGYNAWTGGNTFNGPIKISLTGGGTAGNGFYIAYLSSNPDVFNGSVEVVNNVAAGGIHFSSNSNSVTQFKGDVKFTNTNTGTITIANRITGSDNNANVTIEGNVEVNNSGTGTIIFANAGITSVSQVKITMPADKKIFTTLNSFPSGRLTIGKVTQSAPTAGQSRVPFDLKLGNTGTTLYLLNCDIYGGDFSAGDINVQGCVFHGDVTQTKTSNAATSSEFDNYYEGTVIYYQNGGNTWHTGNSLNSQTYKKDVTFNAGNGVLNASYKNVSNYEGNIILKGAGGTINFSPFVSAGVVNGAVLFDTKKIIADNFNSGAITIRNFEQQGTTLQEITLGGTSSLTITSGTNFHGKVNVNAPTIVLSGASFYGSGENNVSASTSLTIQTGTTFSTSSTLYATSAHILLSGSYFYGPTYIQKTDGGTSSSAGGNTFGSTLQITSSSNTSTGYFNLGTSSPDIFNGDVTAIISGTGRIVLGYGGTGENIFNGNIILNTSTPSNGGFIICSAGWGTLGNGKSIKIGTQFLGGNITINNLKQSDNTSISLTGLTNSTIQFGGGNEIKGDLTLDASIITFTGNGSIYNGIVNVTTTGGTTNFTWSGTQLFNNNVIISHNTPGTGIGLLIGGNTTDIITFKKDVTFNRGANHLFVANKGICEFYGNVRYDYTGSLTTWPYHFGYNGGTSKFLGSDPQIINCNNLGGLLFHNLVIDKVQNHLKANTIINMVPSPNPPVVAPILTLNHGNIIFDGSNYLSLSNVGGAGIVTINANGTITTTNDLVSGGSVNSFVDGPFRRRGSYAFTFPIGKGTLTNPVYAPIYMSAPVNDNFQAEYFNNTPTSGTISSPLFDVSNCEYWNTQRISGSSSVAFTLIWPASNCSPINTSILRVARNNGTSWVDAGANSLTGNNSSGSITTNTLSSFGQLTFGYKSLMVLDTRAVNSTSFNFNSSTEPFTLPFTSGSNGSTAGTKTMVSASNNVPGVIVVHPSLSSTVPVSINSGPQNTLMNIELGVDASSNITTVKGDFEGSMYNMAGDFYSIQSLSGANTKLVFSKQATPSSTFNITTNLPDGITFDVSDLTNFQIIIPGAGFNGYKLRVFDKYNNSVYSSITLTSSPILWNGMNGGVVAAEGTYKFELDIISGSNANTYYGQFILKH